MKIQLSKEQWLRIGQIAGWSPINISDFSDADIDVVSTPEEEEEILLGKEENDPDYAYNSGKEAGVRAKKTGRHDTSDNPYRVDTEEGKKKFDDWMRGFEEGWNKNI